MSNYTESRFWRETLAKIEGADPYENQRDQLRAVYLRMRERAAHLASLIPEDHPTFTVHDITHLDALWGLADLIAGEEVHLNPAEGFVLGAAFLVHDLGMSLAAYPDGLEGLKRDPTWSDTIIMLLSQQLGRRPRPEEVARMQPSVEQLAIGEVLRANHAQAAERLSTQPWVEEETGRQHYLIDDSAVCNAFGSTIGRIAHSHWWSVSEVERQFAHSVMGIAPELHHPSDWTVDKLKLACLVRLADATHLDERRAPHFLRVLRKPSGVAAQHWAFQEKLRFPHRDGDRLVFTSKSAFRLDQAPAWWQGYDALLVADQELRHVHDLLQSAPSQKTFAVRGITGVDDPARLAQTVTIEGWRPINTAIQVGNVAGLVRKLGGEQLYGQDLSVPLRELIQNAADAVRFRRTWETEPLGVPGRVTVRLGRDEAGQWIEVEDAGIGMSSAVLTGPLLDFGASYWGSSTMLREFPGMLSSSFAPAGRYGIGFFSAFMLGDRVRVTTNRARAAASDTMVLEFLGGAEARPVLRAAAESEYIPYGGTRVRIWFREGSGGADGIAASFSRRGGGPQLTFRKFCARLCATLDVDLYLQEEGEQPIPLVRANDWIDMPGEELLARVWAIDFGTLPSPLRERAATAAQNLRLIQNDAGRPIGRVCLVPGNYNRDMQYGYDGMITAGGLYVTQTYHFAGVLEGEPVTAARNEAVVNPDPRSAVEWATYQAQLVGGTTNEPEELHTLADIIWQMGGSVASLPIALTHAGWVSYADITQWADAPEQVLLLEWGRIRGPGMVFGSEQLHPHVLATQVSGGIGIPRGLQLSAVRMGNNNPNHPPFNLHFTTGMAVVFALSEAWHVDAIELARAANLGYMAATQEVGSVAGQPFFLPAHVLRRPRAGVVPGSASGN